MSKSVTRTHNTKIVATLGPASSTPEMIRKLFEAGVDVFRLNFSHGDATVFKPWVDTIRALEKELSHPVTIFGDLQGPKLRVGRFAGEETPITIGQTFSFDQSDVLGDNTRVQLPHPEIFAVAKVGMDLLVDDGKVRLEVTAVTADKITTKVVAGSKIKDRKGVNVPGVALPINALTDKDKLHLEQAVGLGVDWVAISFVQRPEDIALAKDLLKGRAALIAKIEKPAALERLQEIVELTDGVMVARGDLGVELPPEKVPGAQKRIVRLAREQGKPVIVATQMLESMVEAPTPTRAEASDVATAIFDGTDAVMLSAESASGKYPVEAVNVMARIAAEVEHDELYKRLLAASHTEPDLSISGAITASARNTAHLTRAAAIVTFTTSGKTTLRVARERPFTPVLCLTADPNTARRMMLAYGVRSIMTDDIHDFSEMTTLAMQKVKQFGYAKTDDLIVITAGVPFAKSGSTNILHVISVK